MTAKQYYHFLCAGHYDPVGNRDSSRYCDGTVGHLFNVLRHSYNKYEPVPADRVMDGYDLLDFDVVVRVASWAEHNVDLVDPDFIHGGLFYVDFISPGEAGDEYGDDDTYFACDFGVTPALAFLAAIDAWFILVSRTFGGDPGYARLLGRRFADWLDTRGVTC